VITLPVRCRLQRLGAVSATSIGKLGGVGGVGVTREADEVGRKGEADEVVPSAQIGPGRSPSRSEVPILALTLVLALRLALAQVHTNQHCCSRHGFPSLSHHSPFGRGRQPVVCSLQPAVCRNRRTSRVVSCLHGPEPDRRGQDMTASGQGQDS
jgi:hypothetical protein